MLMKSSIIMYLYAGFLMACGFAAFALSNFEKKAITGLIAGGAAGLLMIICAAMANVLPRNRSVGMIGIHIGLVLPLLFAGVFAWRGYDAWQGYRADTKPLHLPAILAVMALGSLVAFVLILRTRPAPAMRR